MKPRSERSHSPMQALAFRAKAMLFQARRAALNSCAPLRSRKANTLGGAPVVAVSNSKLWTEHDPRERVLLLGKVHNLRRAIRALDGVEVEAGKVFSFWAHVGRPSRRRGYVAGRELREGCIIPSVGGGLCQLSNALYDAALTAGLEIVERHAHTQVIAGSLAETGRDATVFWNYVDLRFRAAGRLRIEAEMDAEQLVVRFRAHAEATAATPAPGSCKQPALMGNCITCNMTECFRHAPQLAFSATERRAFLVDEYWPEHDAYITSQRRAGDLLAVPLDGARYGKPNYAWSTGGFGRLVQSRWVTLRRAWASRRLAAQGAARQGALLAASENLARSQAKQLDYTVAHVTVMQNLLPFLWRDGHLAGRSFDVLMTTLPLAELHERLDAACAANPQSPTLGDFRAPAGLVEMESAALRHANRLITPHSDIAKIYPEKTTLLDWARPTGTAAAPTGKRVVFTGPCVGRKGAYELRAAIDGMDLELVALGRNLEGPDFWAQQALAPAHSNSAWLDGASAVVCPAWVENKPRRLLEAAARGVTVIASTACGLERVPGIISLPPGDIAGLRRELARISDARKCT